MNILSMNILHERTERGADGALPPLPPPGEI